MTKPLSGVSEKSIHCEIFMLEVGYCHRPEYSRSDHAWFLIELYAQSGEKA